jgi:hypothetical protein
MKPDFTTDAGIDTHIEGYRHAVAPRDAATTDDGRGEWIFILAALRQQWAQYSGDDDLHEHAFGEPDEP